MKNKIENAWKFLTLLVEILSTVLLTMWLLDENGLFRILLAVATGIAFTNVMFKLYAASTK